MEFLNSRKQFDLFVSFFRMLVDHGIADNEYDCIGYSEYDLSVVYDKLCRADNPKPNYIEYYRSLPGIYCELDDPGGFSIIEIMESFRQVIKRHGLSVKEIPKGSEKTVECSVQENIIYECRCPYCNSVNRHELSKEDYYKHSPSWECTSCSSPFKIETSSSN
jgi:hypothetical protein